MTWYDNPAPFADELQRDANRAYDELQGAEREMGRLHDALDSANTEVAELAVDIEAYQRRVKNRDELIRSMARHRQCPSCDSPWDQPGTWLRVVDGEQQLVPCDYELHKLALRITGG